jgi:hypothetical protein
MTNQEIAEALFLSINTIKTHLSSVYRKLGVSQPAAGHRAGPPARAALAGSCPIGRASPIDALRGAAIGNSRPLLSLPGTAMGRSRRIARRIVTRRIASRL